jgi:arginine utilization protein RocB
MQNNSQLPDFSDTEKVLRAIIYFDLFQYPLTAKEIFERSNVDSIEAVESVLQKLKESKLVFEHEVLFVK